MRDLSLVVKLTDREGQSGEWRFLGVLTSKGVGLVFEPARACLVGREEDPHAWTTFDPGYPAGWQAFAERFVDDTDPENPPEPWNGQDLILKVLTPHAGVARMVQKELWFGWNYGRTGDIVLPKPPEVPLTMREWVMDLREKLAVDLENLCAAAEYGAPAARRAVDLLQGSQIDFEGQARKVIEEMRRLRVPLAVGPACLPGSTERRASDRALILRLLHEVEEANRRGQLRQGPKRKLLREFTAAVRRFVDETRE